MIEKLYNKLHEEIDTMKVICDRNMVELTNDNLRIDIRRHRAMGAMDMEVKVKKKCSFSKFFNVETLFVWHLKNDEDTDLLIQRLDKIQKTTLKDGPYGFSRRSTYIKRKNNIPVAMSGNFVGLASVEKVVTLGEGGLILDDLASPGREPWFLIETSASTSFRTKFGSPEGRAILYNLDHWWPVSVIEKDNSHATSVLNSTDGKLLTMHDKFVIDLSVKIFNENKEQS